MKGKPRSKVFICVGQLSVLCPNSDGAWIFVSTLLGGRPPIICAILIVPFILKPSTQYHSNSTGPADIAAPERSQDKQLQRFDTKGRIAVEQIFNKEKLMQHLTAATSGQSERDGIVL